MNIPDPIFKQRLSKISWTKIYEREYGVQYSELAVSLLNSASYHFPHTTTDQIVIPGENGENTVFYMDAPVWIKLVEGLNEKYTSSAKNLAKYEKQFLYDAKEYHKTTKKIAQSNSKKVSNKKLLSIYLDHQDKRARYSVFPWSTFILNNYVADRATKILDVYIEKYHKEDEKQEYYDSLFAPEKRAAVLELQYEVEKHKGKLSTKQFNNLYNRFKWLACLDIQKNAQTKKEFKKYIEPFASSSPKKEKPFSKVIKDLKELVLKRKKGFVIYLDKGKKTVCLQGNQIHEVIRKFKLIKEKEKSIELTGRVASKGKARGTVAIIKGVKDLHKVKDGNILVSITTHPDYVSAMRKASAIVTDEGGITSHAAIVSREFGIPCIVGCKHATKLLKDGDLVEVDAEKGKIIKL